MTVGAESPKTVRLKLTVCYDGLGFHGWAEQPELRTVEGELVRALHTVLQEPVVLTVAGRTDAGVHALGQIAHLDVDLVRLRQVFKEMSLDDMLGHLRDRLNRLLVTYYHQRCQNVVQRGALSVKPIRGVSDVTVNQIRQVSSTFDARFSASARHYRYLLADCSHALNPLRRGDTWWCGISVDEKVMDAASHILVGCHDFLSFCKPRQGATTIRTLKSLKVYRDHVTLYPTVVVDVVGDAFCHMMVRSLVGALVEVGSGRKNTEWLRELVGNPSRSHSVPVAPAVGLTLVKVDYPPSTQWAKRNAEARSKRVETDLNK